MEGQLNVVKYLLSLPNENSRPGVKVDVNQKAIDGTTPFHLACVTDQLAVVKYLVSEGAIIDATTSNGERPLDVLTLFGSPRCLKFILDLKAKEPESGK